ncbi:nuclear transport factor 2 family protein [Sphingomonas sp.]|uniref:nuclear transport factor 2 family protein n=1 Tax=Sphingomonas sp. TaxID=28214 RepID=UPI003B00A952
MILPLLLALAQITPTQQMPRGTGLPPAVAESAADPQAVLATVQRLLGALETGDRATILAVTRPDGGATAAMERPDGRRMVRRIGWAEFVAGLEGGADRWSEAISDPAVEVDGDIAMVWAPYVVKKNGVADHCGFDHFDLVREAGQWKILNVTWSQRTTGCTP